MMVNEEAQRRGCDFPLDKPGCLKSDASLDLERLVWDPEYRKATRHLWQRVD